MVRSNPFDFKIKNVKRLCPSKCSKDFSKRSAKKEVKTCRCCKIEEKKEFHHFTGVFLSAFSGICILSKKTNLLNQTNKKNTLILSEML
ncbi:unnamed protein product [Gordionus sp. m RMFG-2023]